MTYRGSTGLDSEKLFIAASDYVFRLHFDSCRLHLDRISITPLPSLLHSSRGASLAIHTVCGRPLLEEAKLYQPSRVP